MTLETPPNHHLFNVISNNQLGQLSPLIERRQRGNAANLNTPTTLLPSMIRFDASPELLQVFRPAMAGVPQAAALVNAAHAPVALDTLIPANRIPGPTMSLAEFCEAYKLTDGIQKKLEENGYSGSHTFQYAEWQELKDAGLKAGEIAQMKHALFSWSTVPS